MGYKPLSPARIDGSGHDAKASKPVVASANSTPLQVQCFIHKGELVVAFSQTIAQWFMTPEALRETAKVFNEAAAQIEQQEAAGATKQ
jgi:hypothetical protein